MLDEGQRLEEAVVCAIEQKINWIRTPNTGIYSS